ncbi:MAG: N-acetylmuramoyl-L-alanine amidase family protein, partial [Bacillota bacterium]
MADKPLVVLDPGHGGRSPGAVSRSGLREKEINMAICLAVYQALEGLAEVLLTRQGDENVTLMQRAALANTARADCFVSV